MTRITLPANTSFIPLFTMRTVSIKLEQQFDRSSSGNIKLWVCSSRIVEVLYVWDQLNRDCRQNRGLPTSPMREWSLSITRAVVWKGLWIPRFITFHEAMLVGKIFMWVWERRWAVRFRIRRHVIDFWGWPRVWRSVSIVFCIKPCGLRISRGLSR